MDRNGYRPPLTTLDHNGDSCHSRVNKCTFRPSIVQLTFNLEAQSLKRLVALALKGIAMILGVQSTRRIAKWSFQPVLKMKLSREIPGALLITRRFPLPPREGSDKVPPAVLLPIPAYQRAHLFVL